MLEVDKKVEIDIGIVESILDSAAPVKPVKKKKYSKAYYADAAKKARRRKRESLEILKRQTHKYETEMPFLRHKIGKLKEKLDDLLEEQANDKTFEVVRAENEILKRELKRFRLLSKETAKVLGQFIKTQSNLGFSTIFNKNLYFMINKISKLVELTKITLPRIANLHFSDPKIEWINILLPYVDPSLEYPLNFQLPNLTVKSFAKEIRFPSLARLMKIEVEDIPMNYRILAKLWREIASNDKLCWVLNLHITGLTELLSVPNPTPIKPVDNSTLGSYENFETNVRNVYHDTDEAVFLAATHSNEAEEYVASFFVPSLEVELSQFDNLGTSLFHGGRLTQGSNADSTNFCICFSLQESSPGFNEEGFKQANEKMERFDFFQFMKKHYTPQYCLEFVQALVELTIVVYHIRHNQH